MKKIILFFLCAILVIIAGFGLYTILFQRDAHEEPVKAPPEVLPEFPVEPEKTPSEEGEIDLVPQSSNGESLNLNSSTHISGVLLDHQGEPLSGAAVELYYVTDFFGIISLFDPAWNETTPLKSAKTSPEGRFAFKDILPARYTIIIKPADLPEAFYGKIFTPLEDYPLENLEIRYPEMLQFKGRVQDESGNPLNYVKVKFFQYGFPSFNSEVLTGNDGIFEFQIPERERLYVSAEKTGFGRSFMDEAEIDDLPATETLTLTLKPGIDLSGKVLMPDETPARFAEILPFQSDAKMYGRSIPFARHATNENGEFLIKDLPPGKIRLNVRGPVSTKIIEKDITLPLKEQEDIVINLEKGPVITGSVVDDDGTSVPGVFVYYDNGFGLKNSITKENGKFTLHGMNADPLDIYAESAFYAEGKIEDVLPGNKKLQITLNRGGSVSGTVRDRKNREPVSHASVHVKIMKGKTEGALTSVTGKYVLGFQTPGSAEVEAGADDYAWSEAQKIKIEKGEILTGIDFLLGKGSQVTGCVLEEENNRPIVEAFVFMYENNGSTYSAETDRQGCYKIENVRGGDYKISASATNYKKSDDYAFNVPAEGEVKAPTIFLSPSAGIRGIVKNSSGEVVPDADVFAFWGRFKDFASMSSDAAERSTVTDEEGRFQLNELPDGEGIDIYVDHDNYARKKSGPYVLEDAEVREVEIIITPGGSISGKITSSEGGVPENPRVTRFQSVGGFFAMDMGVTMGHLMEGDYIDAEDDGNYIIKNLQPGKYRVLAKADGCIYEIKEDIEVKEGETTENVDFVLEPGVILAGHVFNDKKEPVPDALVMFMGIDFKKPQAAMDKTDESGFFKVDSLPPRSFMATVNKKPYPDIMEMNIQAPDENLEFILSEGGKIKGVVIDAKTKKPVEDFVVQAKYTAGSVFGNPMMQGRRNNRSSVGEHPDGEFEIENLKEGKYSLVVNAEEYTENEKSGVKVKNGEVTKDIIIELKKGVTVEGKVVSAKDESPVPGAEVIEDKEKSGMMGFDPSEFMPGNRSTGVKTDSEGRFTMENLAPGLTTLKATKDGFLQGKKMIFVRDDIKNEEVVIELTEGGTVKGKVVSDASGEVVPAAEVTFTGQGFLQDLIPFFKDKAVSDSSGDFVYENVPPGSRTIKISAEDFSDKLVENIQVSEGETVDLGEIRLTSGGGIQGIVIGEDAEPMEGAVIFSVGPGGMKQADTDSEGEYEISGLTPGSYQVTMLTDQSGMMMGMVGKTEEKQAEVKEGEFTEVNFILTPGYNLFGQVTRQGEPATDVMIGYNSVDPLKPPKGGGSISVDDEGKYKITELDPGMYQIMVYATGAGMSGQWAPLFRGEVEVQEDTEYNIEIPVSTVSGRVFDAENGQPVAGATVRLAHPSADISVEDIIRNGLFFNVSSVTDSDGYYEMKEVKEGEYRIIAVHEDYSYDTKIISLSSSDEELKDVNFRLTPGLSVKGTARLLETGSPPQYFFLQMRNSENAMIHSSEITPDNEGMFSITGLREDDYMIDAFPENAAPLYNVPCSVSSGSENTIQLLFEKGGELVVTVQNPSEEPVSEARVDILFSDGKPLQLPMNFQSMIDFKTLIYTDAQGNLTRKHLPSGSYILKISAEDYIPSQMEISIMNDSVTQKNIILQPAG